MMAHARSFIRKIFQTTYRPTAANYDSIIMMVVNDECATSGSSGNGVRTINGVSVTSNFLFNSVRASVVQQSSCSGWSALSQIRSSR